MLLQEKYYLITSIKYFFVNTQRILFIIVAIIIGLFAVW